MFVWTFEGILSAIGWAIVVILLLVCVVDWLVETIRGGKK